MQYFPRSLGIGFQNYLPQVLPAILDGIFTPCCDAHATVIMLSWYLSCMLQDLLMKTSLYVMRRSVLGMFWWSIMQQRLFIKCLDALWLFFVRVSHCHMFTYWLVLYDCFYDLDLYRYSFRLLRMAFLTTAGVSGKVLLNFWVIYYSRWALLILFWTTSFGNWFC